VTSRDLLLDAAYDAALAGDWDRVRMGDVAKAAGLSRQTLYYEFGSKDGLAEAVALREADRWIAGALEAIEGHEGSPAEAIAAATVWTLEEAGRNPLLKAVLTDDQGGLIPWLTTRSEHLQERAREHLEAYLEANTASHWPTIDPVRRHLAADTVVRLTFSHLVLAGGRPDEVARDLATIVTALLEN
jgi:AcrR family transcriptional regulator